MYLSFASPGESVGYQNLTVNVLLSLLLSVTVRKSVPTLTSDVILGSSKTGSSALIVPDTEISNKAKMILANWETYLAKFWQVVPPSEAEMPEAKAVESEERSLTSVQ